MRAAVAPRDMSGICCPRPFEPSISDAKRICSCGSRTGSARTRGSMSFVYLHVVLFLGWMLMAEHSPSPILTLVVSPELELRTNTEITHAIHVLTTELHRRVVPDEDAVRA